MSDEKHPLVSVIMATFNESAVFVDASIKSILTQSYQNLELLIMDDSTNEETIECIDKFDVDDRVKVIRKNNRMGLSGARNVGLANSLGEYIAIMDGDDVSMQDRIMHQVQYLKDNPECYVLGGQMRIIDENGTVISERHYPVGGIKLKIFAAVRNPISHPTVMFRRELFDKGFKYDETLEMSEDLDLWLRVMNADYEIRNLDEFVINYRVGTDFTVKRTSKKQKKYMADVRKKNWSFSHPFFSVTSVVAGMVFRATPSSTLTGIYNKENRKKTNGE